MTEVPSEESSGAVNEAPRAFLALCDHRVVEVAGDDRVGYLHDVLTQHVAGLDVGEHAASLYLDAKGRPLGVMELALLHDRILLVVPGPDLADQLAESLSERTFLKDAVFTPLDWRVAALRGTGAAEVAATAELAVDPGRLTVVGGAVVVLGREQGADLLGPADRVEELAGRLADAGAERVGTATLEAWQTAAGVPTWEREIRAPHLPEEMGLLPTHVHLDKGCYPGQEAIARMWTLGRPRRRLARVELMGEVPAGWTSGSVRQPVEVTSVATWNGEAVGLAYVPRDAAPGDRYGEEDGPAVVVRDLIGADQPIPGHDPSATRRRNQR